ncbi:nucleotide exchange factor GrpE [Temperatibacter marinus]|uniref:Protein GrpE n=1 Tax=Temperatibacter marinus TaxID=1456591 RepID=A0AA52HAI2_9PROT|nr:nucleotide exchange factor GrpE [Temperatibacter marinus]WND03652.1 nucleotide exchange factor GrpE [Temperatibacter marinus]
MTEETKNDLPENEEVEVKAPSEETEAPAEESSVEEDAVDPVEALTIEVADLKDRLLRAMAETENVRRRADRDKTDASAYAVTGFARDMLDVADNLGRALDSQPDEIADDMTPFVEGVDMTKRNLLQTLEKHGIKEVNPEIGEKFDPNLHQAMFEVPVPPENPGGAVMQVVAKGYVIKDRLLRPAMVGVSKAAPAQKVDQEA